MAAVAHLGCYSCGRRSCFTRAGICNLPRPSPCPPRSSHPSAMKAAAVGTTHHCQGRTATRGRSGRPRRQPQRCPHVAGQRPRRRRQQRQPWHWPAAAACPGLSYARPAPAAVPVPSTPGLSGGRAVAVPAPCRGGSRRWHRCKLLRVGEALAMAVAAVAVAAHPSKPEGRLVAAALCCHCCCCAWPRPRP